MKVQLSQNIVTGVFKVVAPNFVLYTSKREVAAHWFRVQEVKSQRRLFKKRFWVGNIEGVMK